LNEVIQIGFPIEWTTSLTISLLKNGYVNNPSNYQTIMINPLFEKLFGSMLQHRISIREKEKGKRAKGKGDFRPKHSTIDKCITLRNIVEQIWDKKEEAFCFFVEFKKVFDTISRETLWSSMEELDVLIQFRVAVHRLYEHIRARIQTQEGLSKYFGSDIGFK